MSSATPRQQVECVMEFMKDYEKTRLPRDYIGAPPPLDTYQLHDDVPPGFCLQNGAMKVIFSPCTTDVRNRHIEHKSPPV